VIVLQHACDNAAAVASAPKVTSRNKFYLYQWQWMCHLQMNADVRFVSHVNVCIAAILRGNVSREAILSEERNDRRRFQLLSENKRSLQLRCTIKIVT